MGFVLARKKEENVIIITLRKPNGDLKKKKISTYSMTGERRRGGWKRGEWTKAQRCFLVADRCILGKRGHMCDHYPGGRGKKKKKKKKKDSHVNGNRGFILLFGKRGVSWAKVKRRKIYSCTFLLKRGMNTRRKPNSRGKKKNNAWEQCTGKNFDSRCDGIQGERGGANY